jgi:hypothetical protein
MLLSFLAAVSAAIVVITFGQTWAAYPALPDRVPLGLAWNGVPRGFGPRPMIWLIVAVQIFAACVMAFADYAIATHQPGTHGTLLGSLIASVCVLAILWRAQMLLIASAKSGASRVPMNGFLTFCGAMMVLLLIDVFVIG